MNDTPKRRAANPAATAAAKYAVAKAGPDRQFSIGELAGELDISTRTIRFYETKGLIAPLRRGVARSYTRRDRARLRLILRGKNLGFTLDEVGEYLELYDADPAHLAQLQHLSAKIDAHIDALNQKRTDLDRTLRELKDIRAQVVVRLGKPKS